MLHRLLSCVPLVALCVVAQETKERESRLVVTAQGPVRGYKDPNDGVYVFYNIPYATTPTGPNRFKAPLSAPTWKKPLEAINRKIICPQTGDILLNKTVLEDCLVANVYVPDTDIQNLPVLVNVHGGGFQNGYGTVVVLNTLVRTKNLIVVTFNYRLGVHGFLCLGTEDAPGNAGMKDQVALLRWVQKNIAKFGGNPHDVTIAGCSAGSASVDLLMLSKTTKGLFNKVIAGSGASLSPFSVQIDPLENALDHAKSLNFTNVHDISALADFYKTVSFDLLLPYQYVERKDVSVTFAPCVEQDLGQEMFLDEAPLHTFINGNYRKIPVIYGFADMEGLIRLPWFEDWKDDMNENFSDFLPVDLYFPNEEEKEEVAKTIKEFYFGNQPVNENTILSYIDFFSDIIFTHSILWTISMQLKNGNNNIYLYEYSYVDEDLPPVPYTDVQGAIHCAQEFGVADGIDVYNIDETSTTENFKKLKDIMREMWYNFVTTSQPVHENSSLPFWPPVSSNNWQHISFGQTVELRNSLLEQRIALWNNIYDRYYQPPQAPMPQIRRSASKYDLN